MNFPENKLLVNEIFASIQGEGKSIGSPVVFVRLFGCNSKCKFCDSSYAWNQIEKANNINPERTVMSIEELITAIQKKLKKGIAPHIVLTGGEPLLQQDSLIKVFTVYKEKFGSLPYIEVETNGTITPKAQFDVFVQRYNVSPKLSKSTQENNSSSYLKRIKI